MAESHVMTGNAADRIARPRMSKTVIAPRPGSWLAPRVQLASGVTVREAVKPLAPGTREMLMAGYRGKYPVTLPAPH